MNHGLIINSLKYVSKNFKLSVSLSIEINDRLSNILYTDLKLKQSVNCKDIDAASFLINFNENNLFLNSFVTCQHIFEEPWLKLFIKFDNYDFLYYLLTESCDKNNINSVEFLLKNYKFKDLCSIINLRKSNEILYLILRYETNKKLAFAYASYYWTPAQVLKFIKETSYVPETVLEVMHETKLMKLLLKETNITIPIQTLYFVIISEQLNKLQIFLDHDHSLIDVALSLNISDHVRSWIVKKYIDQISQ